MEPGAIFFVVMAELKVKFDFNLHLLNLLLFEWQCSLLYDNYSYTGTFMSDPPPLNPPPQ